MNCIIETITDFNEIVSTFKMHPSKYRNIKVAFICANCKTVSTKTIGRLNSFPILCRCCLAKKTSTERYGNANFRNSNKRQNTCLEKYGTAHPLQNKDVIKKVKTTCIERYGEPSPLGSTVVREKIHNTNLKKYGSAEYLASSDAKIKTATTCATRYGVTAAAASDVVKRKIVEANMAKYGCAYPMQSEQTKINFRTAMKEKHGVENPFKLNTVREKSTKSLLLRYGVANPNYSPEIRKMMHRKYEYDGIKFDSRPEIEFYKKLKENFTDFEHQPNVSFEYEYNSKVHKYYPDFKVGNAYYEIKGSHFFDENGKMINPFDRSMDGLYEAKHQCMLTNGIRIIKV